MVGASSDDDAEVELWNDTEATLQLLKGQFQAKDKVPPFALKTQLYSVLQDRTLVDRQLDEMRLKNKLRVFQLPTGGDDYAIMLSTDYAVALQTCAQRLASKGALVHVFDWFRDRVLPACCDVMVTHTEIMMLLRGRGAQAVAVSDAHLSLLLHEGFLVRHSHGSEGYLFSMPGGGPAVRSIREGRAEIVQALQRRQYTEIPERDLEKRKLQRSLLGVRFHVRDMLGSGALLRLQTTVGPVLRLAHSK